MVVAVQALRRCTFVAMLLQVGGSLFHVSGLNCEG